MRRLFVCVPAYQYIPAESFQSILNTCLRLKSDYKLATFTSINTYLPESRNMIADKIVETSDNNDDLVLWLDADMVFDFNSVKELVESFDSND